MSIINQLENIIERYLQEDVVLHIQSLTINIIVAICLYWIGSIIIDYFVRVVHRVAEKRQVNPEVQQFFDGMLGIGLKVILVITILSGLGVDTTSLLAAFGALGLAIGLALKDSLSNVASGIMLISTQPFRIGHLVEIGKVKGFIEAITLFTTTIRTPDNRRVFVPNAKINQEVIFNFSVNPIRRVEVIVSMGYDEDLRNARIIIESTVAANEFVISSPALNIVVCKLDESSIHIQVRAWVKSEHYSNAKGSLLENIKYAFDQEGICFPYPKRDVYLSSADNK